MTYEQYWYGDVWMVEAFRESHKLKQRYENQTAWMIGGYVLRAIDATVGNMTRKQGAQMAEYPAMPVGEDKERESAQKTQEEEDREAALAKLYMFNMVRMGKAWGKQQQQGGEH